MMKIFVLDNEILGCSRPPYDDGLDVLKVGQPVTAGVFSSPFEEIVSGFFDQPFKPLGGLSTLAVFPHDV